MSSIREIIVGFAMAIFVGYIVLVFLISEAYPEIDNAGQLAAQYLLYIVVGLGALATLIFFIARGGSGGGGAV